MADSSKWGDFYGTIAILGGLGFTVTCEDWSKYLQVSRDGHVPVDFEPFPGGWIAHSTSAPGPIERIWLHDAKEANQWLSAHFDTLGEDR